MATRMNLAKTTRHLDPAALSVLRSTINASLLEVSDEREMLSVYTELIEYSGVHTMVLMHCDLDNDHQPQGSKIVAVHMPHQPELSPEQLPETTLHPGEYPAIHA